MVIGFVLAFGAIYIGRAALVMILVAFFLALVLNRPVSFIAKYMPGKSRIVGTLVAYLLILTIIAAVGITVLPFFIQQIASFVSTLPDTIQSLQGSLRFVTDFVQDHGMEQQYDQFVQNMQESISRFGYEIGSSFISMATGFMNGLANLLLMLVLTFLMLVEGPRWHERFWRLVYKNRDRRRHHQQLSTKMYNVVSSYVTGQVLVALTAAIATGVGIFAMSFFLSVPVSVALPAAAVVFVTAFIPMFGAMIGGVVAGLLIVIYNFPAALIFGVYFIIYQQIENNFIVPKIQSKKLNMSALAVLISVIIGIKIGGILGAFVAIPIGGCVMIVAQDYLARRKDKDTTDCDTDETKVVLAAVVEAEREAKGDVVTDEKLAQKARRK